MRFYGIFTEERTCSCINDQGPWDYADRQIIFNQLVLKTVSSCVPSLAKINRVKQSQSASHDNLRLSL